ncbi:MAG: DUF5666 domain-containing protein [Dehalococcoidia bacterium]
MTTKPFDEILDECLSLLRAGSTIDECAAVYPEHADELRGQLAVARAMITARPPDEPSNAVRSESRARLLSAVAGRSEGGGVPSRGLAGLFGAGWGRWALVPRVIPIAIAMVVLGSAAWGVSAATTGDPNPGTWFASSSHPDRVELRGTIKAIDATALTITTADGDVTVQIAPDTKFDDDSDAKTEQAAFAVGDVVKVSAVRDATGALIAREVELESNDANDGTKDQPGNSDGDQPGDQDADHQGKDDALNDNSGPGSVGDGNDDADSDDSGPDSSDDHGGNTQEQDDDPEGDIHNSGTSGDTGGQLRDDDNDRHGDGTDDKSEPGSDDHGDADAGHSGEDD